MYYVARSLSSEVSIADWTFLTITFSSGMQCPVQGLTDPVPPHYCCDVRSDHIPTTISSHVGKHPRILRRALQGGLSLAVVDLAEKGGAESQITGVEGTRLPQ